MACYREVAALCEALDDEFKAIATYDRVIADFGAIRPFVNIVEAERRHANALLAIFQRYNIAVPDDPWADDVPRFSSLHEACLAGVEGEIESAAMYSRLIAATSHLDIIEVFENLQRAPTDVFDDQYVFDDDERPVVVTWSPSETDVEIIHDITLPPEFTDPPYLRSNYGAPEYVIAHHDLRVQEHVPQFGGPAPPGPSTME